MKLQGHPFNPVSFNPVSNVHLLINMENYSFPSGHAVASFTGCIVLGKKYGYHIIFYSFFAGVIAFSRIYMMCTTL